MKANIKNVEILMADKCIDKGNLQRKSQISRPTINKIFSGCSVRPITLGKLAKGLEVDVYKIIEEE